MTTYLYQWQLSKRPSAPSSPPFFCSFNVIPIHTHPGRCVGGHKRIRATSEIKCCAGACTYREHVAFSRWPRVATWAGPLIRRSAAPPRSGHSPSLVTRTYIIIFTRPSPCLLFLLPPTTIPSPSSRFASITPYPLLHSSMSDSYHLGTTTHKYFSLYVHALEIMWVASRSHLSLLRSDYEIDPHCRYRKRIFHEGSVSINSFPLASIILIK